MAEQPSASQPHTYNQTAPQPSIKGAAGGSRRHFMQHVKHMCRIHGRQSCTVSQSPQSRSTSQAATSDKTCRLPLQGKNRPGIAGWQQRAACACHTFDKLRTCQLSLDMAPNRNYTTCYCNRHTSTEYVLHVLLLPATSQAPPHAPAPKPVWLCSARLQPVLVKSTYQSLDMPVDTLQHWCCRRQSYKGTQRSPPPPHTHTHTHENSSFDLWQQCPGPSQTSERQQSVCQPNPLAINDC
jgi:hypothetical protein